MLQGCQALGLFMLLIKLQQIELANILYMLLSMFLLLIKSQQPELIMGILFLLLIKMHHLLLSQLLGWLGLECFGDVCFCAAMGRVLYRTEIQIPHKLLANTK
jgi:hypothetical protein